MSAPSSDADGTWKDVLGRTWALFHSAFFDPIVNPAVVCG